MCPGSAATGSLGKCCLTHPKVPKKRRFSLNVIPAAEEAGADVDDDGVAPLSMSKDMLRIQIRAEATALKIDGSAVAALVLNDRYLNLLKGSAGGDAEESANYRVKMEAKIEGLEADLVEVKEKLNQLLAR